MRKNRWLILSAFLILAILFCSCGTTKEAAAVEPAAAEESVVEEEAPAEKLKIAFIYIGQPGDLGYTYEHERGRLMLEEALGDQVETITVPDVPEGPDAEKAIRDVVEAGAKIVFTTSYGYMDPTAAVAAEYPDVIFEHCSGYLTSDNMSNYFGRIYQARYLAGIVAGMMTENNFIGYVGAFAIPEVIRGIDAFTIGAKSVNPDVEVHVVWTNTWYDPVIEREAAVALLDEGADIIAQHQDTTEPQKAAQEAGKLSIGYDSDMAQFVGDTVLTGPMWNWGVYYISTVQAVLDGTWTPHSYWGGLADNVVMLADFSPLVPADVIALVEEEKALIVDGSYDPFCGPILNQDGEIIVPEGECMSDADLLSLNWFVDGVVGTIPADE